MFIPRLAVIWLVSALIAFSGCSERLTGPVPSISGTPGDSADAPTAPGFVCNEQQDIWIELHGSGFSPLVTDVLADSGAKAILPSVRLLRSASVEGEEDDVSGFVSLEATEGEDSPIRWLSATRMAFRITPGLALPDGVYDITVTNGNGNATTRPGAFGLVPRPVVTGVVDDLLCLDDGDRQVTINGDNFLVRGEDGLPSVDLGGATYTAEAAAGCRALAEAFGGHRLCQSLTVTIPQGDLPEGPARVGVTNIDPAGCQSDKADDGVDLFIVPAPTLTDIQPEPICSEQLDYEGMLITGEGLLRITRDGQIEVPTIEASGQAFAVTEMEGCEPFEGPVGETVEVCTGLRFDIRAGEQSPGNQPIKVTNPQPAGCDSKEPVELTVLPPPDIDAIEPSPICTAQGESTLTITGEGFVSIDGAGPIVTIDGNDYGTEALDGCVPVEGPATDVQTCTSLTLLIPEGDFDRAAAREVTITNPDPVGCVTNVPGQLVTVPPPVVDSTAPDFFCSLNAQADLRIAGSGFVAVGDTLPTVQIGEEVFDAAALEDCAPIEGAEEIQVCTALRVAVDRAFAESALPLQVINPDPAGCVSAEGPTVQALGLPSVISAAPILFCVSEGEVEVAVTGAGFLTIDGALPTVFVGEDPLPADSANGCEAVPDLSADVQRCTGLTVTVPEGGLPVDLHTVSVQNPAPAACTSEDPDPVQVVVAGGPRLLGQSPEVICRGQFDGAITLTGTGFFEVDGVQPDVRINGVEVAVDTLDGCEPVPGLDNIQSCTSLNVTVPEGLREEALTVFLTNPAPADCEPTVLELDIEEPPRIDDVQPQKVCSTGGSLTLTGDFFQDGMVVTLDGVEAETVDVISPSEAVATWAGPLEAGLAELSATNTAGCFDTFETLIRVTDGPLVFFIDPQVVYNGIAIQATVYLGNLFGGSVSRVVLTDEQDQGTELDFTFDPTTPNRVQAIVPAGLAAGLYDVTIFDEIGCEGTTVDLLHVTDELRIGLGAVFPPFGWNQAITGVTLDILDPLPDGQIPFEATPRTYINPSIIDENTVAIELRAAALVSSVELTGVVAEGLPAGEYDVIVVNPDATVGVLEEAFTVTDDPPPRVDAVSPGSWETNITALEFLVEGEGFRDPMISAECLDSGGQPLPAPNITVVDNTDGAIDAQVNTGTLAHLSVCVLRVTNSDGTFEDFSPVTVTNPAGNFVAFRSGTQTTTARRAAAVFSGTPSRTARFIYAVGGDDGQVSGALDSGELSSINRFGEPGPWRPLPAGLPEPRTKARVERIDDFVYLVGGDGGGGPVDTVLRAQILDPLDVPTIDNLDFDFTDGDSGVEAGFYIYRVSAVLSDDSPNNPNGETLTSEPQPVFVPDLPQQVQVFIEWTEIANAVSYRIYRSPAAGLTFGQEQLLAEIPATERDFLDDGSGTFTGAVPLPIGALGSWHTFATLGAVRAGHGLAVATDPGNPALRHLYVAGGEGGAGALASIEVLSIDVNGPRDQTLGAQQFLDAAFSPARADLEILVADAGNASVLNAPMLYVLSGRDGNAQQDDVNAAPILAGGGLGAFVGQSALRPVQTGYAAAVANNTLVAVGGQNGGPSSSGRSSGIANAQGTLDNWNSLGNTNMTSRVFMGRVVFGGFFYLVGGQSDLATADDSMDFSILGGVP